MQDSRNKFQLTQLKAREKNQHIQSKKKKKKSQQTEQASVAIQMKSQCLAL